MVRTRINVLALAVILAGGAFLGVPGRALAAEADVKEVCCDGAANSRCCGTECKATQEGCTACNSWFSCLFV